MSNKLQYSLKTLFNLDERVLEVDLAHREMVESLLAALTIAKEIDEKISLKWYRVVIKHRRLGSQIRQLLREVHEIKRQLNASQ